MPVRSVFIAAFLIIIYLTVEFLWYSQSILIPFIFAVLIWNLLGNFLQQRASVRLWACQNRNTDGCLL